MSEARVTILANVRGLENIDKLKGAFRGLEQAIGPTDQAINRAREDILNFGNAGRQTEQVFRGQIAALRGLREQATIGGQAYRQLATDIASISSAYDQVASSATRASEAQRKGRPMSRESGEANAQISLLKRDLQQLDLLSQEYTDLLANITAKEATLGARVGRQKVLAGSEAFNGRFPDPFRESVQPQLPDTTAGLNQRLSELSQSYANTNRQGEDYLRIAREIAAVQRELARDFLAEAEAIQVAARAEEQRAARQAVHERIWQQRNTNSGFGGFSARASAITEAANRQVSLPGYQVSQLYQSINATGMGRINAQIEMMGNSYSQVAVDIRRATAASDGSINSLQNQRNAWQSLANSVKRGSDEYKEAQREMQAVDRQLESGGPGRLQRFGETAGAVAASGIFGGPEGLVGSIAGGIVGGPGGALAGGAVGAQVGQIRQQAGQAAEYVAQLNLAKTTLAQASAGQAEYNKLLFTARKISSDYAVGLKETIAGYAQVAVAARANNLSLKQTESVYRGVISAGVAFGKSQEDLDAIVTATVQVLSKGKLSAEELQGQIGERLPGAVAKFAEATGRSLPQLAKDLQSGQVSIADFVKFTEKNVKDYDENAKLIGSSPEKAGARLKLALDTAAETYGGFFQKVGADSQDYSTKIVANLNSSSEGIKRFTTFIINNITFVDKLLGKLEQLTRSYVPDYLFGSKGKSDSTNWFAQYTNNYKELFPDFVPDPGSYGKGAAGTGQLQNLTQKVDTSPALKDQLALALAQEQAAKNTYKTNVDLARTDQLRIAYSQKIVEYNKIERDLADGKLNTQERSLSILKVESDYRTRVNAINRQAQEEAKRQAEKALTVEKDKAQVIAQQSEAVLQFSQIDIERMSYGMTDLEGAKKKLEWLKEIDDIEMKSFYQKSKAMMAEARIKQTNIETAKLLAVQRSTLEDQQAIRARNAELQYVELKYAQQRAELDSKKQLNTERIQAGRTVNGLQIGLAKSLGQSTFALERNQLQSQREERRQQITDSQASIQINEATRDDLRNRGETKYAKEIKDLDKVISRQRDSLDIQKQNLPLMDDLELKQQKLNEFAERYGGIFDQITSGLTKAFDLLVTGTENWGASLKTIASTVLQDIARQLLKVLVIDQAISAFKGLFSPVKASGALSSLFNPATAANGKVFSANGIVPFAMGGIVDRPTIFPFAKGGIGLMGEAGPEAIIPLRRGPDGRLGVAGSGGGGSTTINVSVDAKGTSVQGDGSQSASLARAIAQAVQTEMVKQKRPGGLLAS
jgi:tape measure domain-containing protein